MPRVKCPRCGTIVEHAAGFQPICPACGYGAEAAHAPATSSAPMPMQPPASAMPYAQQPAYGAPAPMAAAKPPPSQGLAIVALVLNIVIWPGLGSLICGRQEGWAQGFLFLLGFFLTITVFFAIVGIPLMVGMWIWGIVTGVNLIKAATPPQPVAMPA